MLKKDFEGGAGNIDSTPRATAQYRFKNPFVGIRSFQILIPQLHFGDFFNTIGQSRKTALRAYRVRFTPVSDRIADIPDRQLGAMSRPSGRGQDGTIRACMASGEYASFQSETTG
jgi:hypothetical protein